MLVVWLPIVSQALLPLALLGALSLARPATRLSWLLSVALVALYLLFVALAGIWLVLPWYLAAIHALLLVPAAILSHRRIRGEAAWPTRRCARVGVGVRLVALVLLAVVLGHVLAGRRPPVEPVSLAWPFEHGTYLVANGGADELLNAHLKTLAGPRFRPFRGQSYGVDFVALNDWGLRARGIAPRDPAAYVIFGAKVLAPCAGVVLGAVDGFRDLAPPDPDRAHLAGNHVLLDCGPVWVLLGHLRRGSVAVRAGERVQIGQPMGRVGNTGNTSEPHLHIHAQRAGSADAPLSGEPVPIAFQGRYPVRNARMHLEVTPQ
jgi:peptidase M23-like protein